MALAATPGGGPLGQQAPLECQDSSDERKTLCISRPLKPQYVIHQGENGFADEVKRFYSPAESLAADRLVELKAQLRNTKGESFWTTATEGIADMLGSQYAFISKRMQFDDEDPTVILPPIGEPESCLLGMSIYYSGGKADGFNAKRAKYIAHNCPCAHMKHNKVLLIPEQLSTIVPNNPNALPEQPEGYLAIPLSLDTSTGHVFGHFGVMWTQKGLDERSCSFGFLEMLLHGLESLIVEQFVEQGLVPHLAQISRAVSGEIKIPDAPKGYTSFSTSLKPYARSLSHELRTPMQGVVGMLDVMFAQVQEAGEGQVDSKVHELFTSLKESIEIVQDSARRAVEAADNVVHAYDMGMGVPDDPVGHAEAINAEPSILVMAPDKRLLPTPVDSMSPARGHKRTRSSADSGIGNPTKSRRISLSDSKDDSIMSETPQKNSADVTPLDSHENNSLQQHLPERNIAPGVRQMDVREALQGIVNDMLRVGGRPDSAITNPIDGGEEIEVRRRFANGDEKVQLIKWSVDSAVPETIVVDEQAFAGLISRVLHNALKFTEAGQINISVRMSPKGTSIMISVEDTGIGIPIAFIPRLFKPFSKEDDSITRSSEGLGLGLMVAKGLARKLNGDLLVVRSVTDGPDRGTEFQMRIPITPSDPISRPVTPYGSRSPSSRLRSTEEEGRLRSTKSHTPPITHSLPATRHNRSLSNVNRFNITSSCASGDQQNSYTPSSLAPSSHVAALEVPSHSIPPPDVITPPISISAEQSHVPPMLRTSTCVPTALRGTGRSASAPKVKLANRLPLAFLVVEDNAVLRRILVRMLEDMGYKHIQQAYDGADAVRQMEMHLRRLRAGEVDYEIDVILMDLWMPTMNGYQATEKINNMFSPEDESLTPPAVLAVTADVTDEATENVAKAGMQGPLTKPYKMKDLERNLLELIL
jgi:signal transduction histidine kinase/AmiR/NasT family two-component response regulator